MFSIIQSMGLKQASTVAANVDQLFLFIATFSTISFIGVVGAIIYFIFRYHRRKSDPEKTPYIEGHPLLEGIIMVGLFFLVMGIFYWGWRDWEVMMKAPANSLEVHVTGRQWLWDFEYLNGRKMLNEVVVPKGKPVRFIMNSPDVIHSFYVPDFRVKQDVVPGTYTSLWFNATETGTFQVYCAEFCGTSHSAMLAKLKVVEPEEYDKWQKTWEWEKKLGVEPSTPVSDVKDEKSSANNLAKTDSKEVPPSTGNNLIERGQKTFTDKGCNACHSVTGATLVGPSLKGVFGHEVELEGGKKVTADENYIRDSIMNPNANVVKGFQPLMPTYKGTLSDDEINGLVAYIKSL